MFEPKIKEESKSHPKLLHYTSMDALRKILHNKTLRFTCLASAKLNDRFECMRKGLEDYAKITFICCFNHSEYEIVPFWQNYGGENREEKILLKINNFLNNIYSCIKYDYCLTSDNKKMFFRESIEYEYEKYANSLIDQNKVSPSIHEDEGYDLTNNIFLLKAVDVDYLPLKHETFTKSYYHNSIGKIGKEYIEIGWLDPTILGLHKTYHWNYENETRLIIRLHVPFHSSNIFIDHIDINLKDSFFNNMEIVVNPWAKDELVNKIKEEIEMSSLDKDVKDSIKISPSEIIGHII